MYLLTSPRTSLRIPDASLERRERSRSISSLLNLSLSRESHFPLPLDSLFTLFSPFLPLLITFLSSSALSLSQHSSPWWVLLRLPVTHLRYAPGSSPPACPSPTAAEIPDKPSLSNLPGGVVEADNSSPNALDPVAALLPLGLAITTMPCLLSSDRTLFLSIETRGG